MNQRLAEKFQTLWESSNSPPDVFTFLEQNADAKPASKLEVLVCDQRNRWNTKHPLQVEDYLARFPDLASDSDCKLDLAVGEFRARQKTEFSPNIDEFLARFSDISDNLRKMLSDSALSEEVSQHPSVAPTETFDSTLIQQRIGRYRLQRVLGEGAFGRVWLGFDEELERHVAIKVPKPERFQSPQDAELYLAEARMVASLDHPHLVPVYDMGRSENGSVYVVSKYIEGSDLKTLIEHRRLAPKEAAALLAVVAQALHHAHQKRVIHRDIKPANILIEEMTHTPYVADFGLAIKEEDYLKSGRMAGTPAYMSPEQARGEGHRLDGRSDIFSLGIVFYELLTGKRPFRGSSSYELLVQISTEEPQPPRERNVSIPAELERICLKALSKRVSDRYVTAADLADDLLHWGDDLQQENKELQIIPKGLRSFDAEDADFFLDLLPGPRSKAGLPESIAFWKSRIEERDPDDTFSVGLIYGPSGCGKSSMVKAGLLPRLSKDVVTVYIEATPNETETRILRGLRKHLPDLSIESGLVETFIQLRRGTGQKIVIILDQFEQWLHAQKVDGDLQLVNALRQCDGENLQTVIMVRDDFGMAAARCMDALEIPVVQGHNYATIDLFDVEHAKKVLVKFGQSFGKLPSQTGRLSTDEDAFIRDVVDGLAQDGKVVSVRLALFAEMVKSKPWNLQTLEDVGGTQGIGVNFLEETFTARTANPKHRQHQQVAREVLKCLLPEVGTDIKGHMRSHADLLESSGYKNRPKDFDELLRILDGELRLITPTDPAGFESDSNSDPDSKYFQLTHDYLVPSLREWLTRKQRETKYGRAELRLEERSALWNSKPENRHLPNWWEWFAIRTLTDKRKWTLPQQTMMQQAGRHHWLRGGIVVVLLLVMTFGGLHIRDLVLVEQNRIRQQKQEEQNEAEASRLVEGLLKADTSQVRSVIDDLKDYRRWANPKLRTAFEESSPNSNAKLHAGLALLPVDDEMLVFVSERLLNISAVQFSPVRNLLADHQLELRGNYWRIAMDSQEDASRRFQAACALASFDSKHDLWKDERFVEFLASHLVRVGPADLVPWQSELEPIKDRLIRPLRNIYKDRNQAEELRSFANNTLVEYLQDDPKGLFDLLTDATEPQFRLIKNQLLKHREQAIQLAEAELKKTQSAELNEDAKEAVAQFRANIAVLLLKFGKSDSVWPLLRHRSDPRTRSYIIHWLGPRGGDPILLLDHFDKETEVSVKRALLLCLGEFDASTIPNDRKRRFTASLLTIYTNHPDPGLHAATEWLLQRWGEEEQLAVLDQGLQQQENQLQEGQRDWYINTQEQTFVILRPDEFEMGSPESEPIRYPDETLHRRRIRRTIALSAKEVTKAQWRAFSSDTNHRLSADDPKLASFITSDNSPMMAMTWYEAAQYCNWLSQQEGIAENQWCYEPNVKGDFAVGMKAKENFWELSGYRLPTEAEWEYACRAGATTSRYYGLSEELLPRYAWYYVVSQNRAWPTGLLKPNDFGLFDMQGNAIEWCQDAYLDYETSINNATEDHPDTSPVLPVAERVLRGGAFSLHPVAVRTAYRFLHKPNEGIHYFGLRPCRTLSIKQ